MIFLLLVLVLVPLRAASRWEAQYYYDENDSSLVINDLKFPSAKRGIAGGYIIKKEKINPTVLTTGDGGSTWTPISVKEQPLTLFFLDESLGWMVTPKGLWQTDEAGRSWKKLSHFPKDMLRVYFLDRQHGWAMGVRQQIFETSDGGSSWVPLSVAIDPKLNPDYTTYQWITFGNPRSGIITGSNAPPRKNPIPDWMEPEKTHIRRPVPSTLMLLQTHDAGKTWAPSTTSIYGTVTRISMAPNGSSLGLIEFEDGFQWPCEVYRFNGSKGGESTRVYRKSDRLITDIALMPGGGAYFTGLEATAVVRRNPIPGKLKVIRTTDYQFFEEMPVDYRASAHRAILAAVDDENVWVATDTGMILKMKSDSR